MTVNKPHYAPADLEKWLTDAEAKGAKCMQTIKVRDTAFYVAVKASKVVGQFDTKKGGALNGK